MNNSRYYSRMHLISNHFQGYHPKQPLELSDTQARSRRAGRSGASCDFDRGRLLVHYQGDLRAEEDIFHSLFPNPDQSSQLADQREI